jgi:hypothetical protein
MDVHENDLRRMRGGELQCFGNVSGLDDVEGWEPPLEQFPQRSAHEEMVFDDHQGAAHTQLLREHLVTWKKNKGKRGRIAGIRPRRR